jgi:glycosyltransferase involved in cell wall biosynthesis
MNVLMLTPDLDDGNPIVGFARTWVKRLATRVERLHVIPVMGGDSPAFNVLAHSLGRERGQGKFCRLWNLYRIMTKVLRQDRPDVVFVHMLPLYVLLMAPLAKAFRVPLILWYTWGHVDAELRLAHCLADRIVTASPESFPLKSDRTVVLGHGIDTEQFCAGRQVENGGNGILAVNRIAPDKDLETLLQAMTALEMPCHIVGATDERDRAYRAHLDDLAGELEIGDRVRFAGPRPYAEMADQYRACTLFVSTSVTGSLDKAVLEAMACEKPIVTCNESFRNVLGHHAKDLMFDRGDHQALGERVNHLLGLSAEARACLGRELREIVIQGHDLDGFIDRLVSVFSEAGGKS